MYFAELKTLQIIVLTLSTLLVNSSISIIFVLFISLMLKDHYYLTTVMSIIASILPYLLSKNLWFFIPIIVNLLICYWLRKKQQQKFEKAGIKAIFLICLGLTSMNYEYWLATVQLGLFYLILALDYLGEHAKFIFLVKVYRVLLPIGALYLSSSQLWEINAQNQNFNSLALKNQQWWYYLAFTLGALFASFISQSDKTIQKQFQKQQSIEIQLQEVKSNGRKSQNSMRSHKNQNLQQKDENAQKKSERQMYEQEKSSHSQLNFESRYKKEEQMNDDIQKQVEKISEQPKQASSSVQQEQAKYMEQAEPIKQNKEQSQSLNLFIVIPFCLIGKGWAQFPLYLYILSLQWNHHHKAIAIFMLITAYISTINWGIDGGQSIFLRILASLLVSKQIRGVAILGQMIRSFWLRASFALVLVILFWFSLLTVNVFHLTFIIVVLLFVVKNEPQYTHSYRHRNWKYLQLLFNVFLILRQILNIVIYYGYQPTQKILQILDLTGISYAYTGVNQLFNLVPLLINSAIALQYLTYTSDIYNKATNSQSLINKYQQLFRPLASIFTIIYYKMIPWASYIVVLGLPALLDFSLSSWILLAWGLTMFAVHIWGKHDLLNYKRMHFFWLGYLRLTAIQIVLRFTFEFLKFDLFAFVQNYPIFQYLVRYQQLFGLAIPRQETVYFKTISRFQVMVSLDLSAIFISFLVKEYYLLLIKYLELPPEDKNPSQEDKNIAEIYNKYINFKLTNWLGDFPVYRRVLVIGCNAVLQLYFPLLGLLACQYYSIQFGLYLAIALLYYLKINLAYYESHVKNNLMQKVLNAMIQWQKGKLGTLGESTCKLINKANNFMQKYKIKWHQKFRFWLMLLTLASILLTHLSKAMTKETTAQLLGEQNVLNIRWWLYIGGCSVQIGYIAHFTKLMLVFIVIERKCCWFINRLQMIQEDSPQQKEQDLAEEVLIRRQRSLENEQQLRMPTYLQQIQSEFILEYSQDFMHKAKQNELVSMRVSILFGEVKLLERSLVMVLVFASLVQVSHPFGIFYLLCAILLNYLGSLSIKTLSKILFIIILAEYFLLLCNYTNHQLYANLPQQFSRFQQQTFLHKLFSLDIEWQQYITFGKKGNQLLVMSVSWILMFIYPFYFRILRKASKSSLQLLQKDIVLGPIAQKLVAYIQQIYSYGLSYSPLVIMLLCLWIYLLDYTVTNLLLTTLTIGFIFLSFLVRDYKDSRQFWRTYFIVLQLIIVCFMVIYMLLQIPMLAMYCTKYLCSSQPIHAQFLKALLLLILQLGLDVTHSHHFNTALDRLEHSKIRTGFQKLAIAQRHNDRKIHAHFKRFKQEKDVETTLVQVQQFLKQYKQNPQIQFDGNTQNYQTKETWFDLLLDFLPQIVDQYLLLSQREIKSIVLEQNDRWRKLRGISQQDIDINDTYIDYFADLDEKTLFQELHNIIAQLEYRAPMKRISRSHISQSQRQGIIEEYSQRKSYMQEELPLQSPELVNSIRASMNESKGQKNQLLYLLLVESIYSNWHYISYFVIILLHVRNLGLLTFLLPIVVFGFGLVSNERAGKQVWRALLILVMIPLLFKFCVQTELLSMDNDWVFLLIGDNLNSIVLQYLAIICIIGECIILKLMGHWNQTSQEIQCMKMALIRNIINHNRPEQRQFLFQMLKQSTTIPLSFSDMTFGRSELKPGYDYSTLLTSLQLGVLIWIFLFYDKMAVKQEVTFYSMIQYNQFSSGMVVLTFIQLIFLLGQRFIAIADLREWNERWEAGLIFKYVLLISNLLMTQVLILLYFPLSSGRYQSNTFVSIMLIINLIGLLVQTLQIKKGLDHASRGFMDRYTWYNGFVYIGYRAVPFLFQFKMFSDWTFTKTSLRIFDWIRLEQIFGRLYVAKCNSLFMSGKRLGSKIQWWKKLLMGYPLLLSIILLIFGPLVLFSGLNPLASLNDVTAGYLEVVLKVNHTNQYPLYTNSHITDIHHLNLSNYDQPLLASYDIDPETVQELQLQQFSDQYWQISQGSYQKLLTQPQDSLYELTIRARFDRNQTGLTSLYVLSSNYIGQSLISPLKQALKGNGSFCLQNLVNTWLRLDNNNGLHLLGDDKQKVCLQARAGKRAKKQYWVVEGGLKLRIASDKFTQAIFGYSVMSFYISIILVIANYFRFLFQGSVHTIITSDLPKPDPLLAMCNAIFKARRDYDLQKEEVVFWRMIDILRSPDTLKALTGDYLEARLKTLKDKPL